MIKIIPRWRQTEEVTRALVSSVSPVTISPNSLSGGPNAYKPTDPSVRDVWISTDTSQFFICFHAGIWTEI